MEAPTGESKIGITENPRSRWSNLRFCIPRGELKLRFESSPSPHMWVIETRVHEELKDKRLNGEWFDVPADYAIQIITKMLEDWVPAPPPPLDTKPKKRRWMPVGKHAARDATIMAYLKLGHTNADVANKFGITTQRVSGIARASGFIRKQGRPSLRRSVALNVLDAA